LRTRVAGEDVTLEVVAGRGCLAGDARHTVTAEGGGVRTRRVVSPTASEES
jgi:hypothetical protein